MDVAAAEEQAGRVGITALGGAAGKYTFDGREISADEARRIDATRIASIEVTKDADDPGATPAIAIYSADMVAYRGEAATGEGARKQFRGEALLHPSVTRIRRLEEREHQSGTLKGLENTMIRVGGSTVVAERATLGEIDDVLVLMDGKKIDPADLRTLDTDAIERIEVLKGAAATRLYSDPAAANGVILITTKQSPIG
jgi:TonB-dependent SusC/RagA subfamily outer membrane receptor